MLQQLLSEDSPDQVEFTEREILTLISRGNIDQPTLSCLLAAFTSHSDLVKNKLVASILANIESREDQESIELRAFNLLKLSQFHLSLNAIKSIHAIISLDSLKTIFYNSSDLDTLISCLVKAASMYFDVPEMMKAVAVRNEINSILSIAALEFNHVSGIFTIT